MRLVTISRLLVLLLLPGAAWAQCPPSCTTIVSGSARISGPVQIGAAPAVSGPTFILQPQNQEVPVGQSATFSALAANAISYQWRKNGSNIAGATASVYATPVTVSGDNNATFQVIVNGVLSSSLATLKVDTLASMATTTISTTSTQVVETNFGGIAVDIFSANDMMGNSSKGFNPIYRQLIDNLVFPGQTFVMNVEGDEPTSPIVPTQTQVLAFTQLYNDLLALGTTTNWFLPGNMCANSTANATAEETLYLANFPAVAFSGMVLGNEPDGACGSTYGANYAAFKTKWDTYRAAVNAVSGGSSTKFSAPSFGGELSNLGYRGNLNSFVTAEAGVLKSVAQHWYALNNTSSGCGSNTPTITQLLAPGAATPTTIDSNFASYVNNAHTNNLLFYMTEMNSVVCGGFSGVSNVMAAGLWLPDALFNLANLGVDGVNIFSDEGNFYDMFGFSLTSAPFNLAFVRPSYYGFLMFQQATQNSSNIIGAATTTSKNVSVWATKDAASTIRIVVLNKDQATAGTVQITLPGYQTATASYLLAPSLSSTSGLTYAGQTFDGSTDGNPLGTLTTWQVPAFNNIYTVQLPLASAVLLTIPVGAVVPFGLNTAPGWVKIPGSVLKGTENHTPCPPNNFRSWVMTMGAVWTDNCNNVFLDPGGAVMDYQRNRLLFFNGGHNDYGGNEVYSLEMTLAGKDITGNPFVANPNTYGPLVRLDNPGPPNTNSGLGVETLPAATTLPQAGFSGAVAYPDPSRPTPNSRHVYSGVRYVPTADNHGMLVLVNGALNATGGSGNHTWTLDLNSINLTCAPQLTPATPCDPLWTDVGNTVPAAGAGSLLEYDPNNGRLWLFENLNGQLYQNVPVTWPGWVSAGSFGAVAGSHSTSVLDPDDDFFIHIGNIAATDSFGYWNLSGWTAGGPNPTHVVPALDATCTTIRNLMGTNLKYYPGLFWDPIGKRVVLYPGFGNALYFIDPKQTPWKCTNEVYGATQGVDYPQNSRTTAGAEGGEGTFTKFNYFPNLDAMALCNSSSEDCWYGHMRRGNLVITNTSGGTLTNRPVSLAQPFRDGDIKQCVNAYIDGVAAATTQTDVKNRYPSGNLKFAIVSFIIPSLTAGQVVHITYDSQPGCNNATPQTKAQLLAAGYNFDASIQLSGTTSPTVSARAILNAATACTDPGADVEGSASLCTYWLQGPIVTAVLLEDRQGRTFDVNTDGAAGSPLHPVFEAWFYPQNNAVQIGMSLEDIWASTTATSSARDQTYNATLTIGSTSPTTVMGPTGSIKQQTRTRWHRTFWLNVADPLSVISIDHNWRYLATTKFTPNWDPFLAVTPTSLSSGANPMQCTPAFYATMSRGLVNVNTGGNFSVGCIPIQIAATGAAEYHGALPTWDIACLMTQDPNVCKVSFQSGTAGGHGDLIGEVPYFYREADASAGHGGFFDAGGTIGTKGRVVSINARTQVALNSVASPNTCNTVFTADWINFGTGGEDIAPWGANNLDTTHEGNAAYVPYLLTGQHYYYDTVLMQGAYAIGLGPGNRACTQPTSNQSLRMGSLGYWYVDQERGQDWAARDNALAAFIAIDGSPEKGYFENFLKQNISVWQGARGLANDYPANSTAYNYGATSRLLNRRGVGSSLGSWTQGQGFADGSGSNYVIAVGSPLNQTGTSTPQSANANFQNGYSAIVVAWIDDLGYTPSGNLRAFMANRYINEILNPTANIFNLAAYTYPTQDNAGLQTAISTFAQEQTFYATVPASWPTCNVGVDEAFPYIAMAATAQYYNLTSSIGGYSGATAYNTLVPSVNCKFTTGSPKWAIVPRGPYGLSATPLPAR